MSVLKRSLLFLEIYIFFGTWIELTQGGQPASPKRLAIIIGINEYGHEKLPSLEYAEADATDLAKLLLENGYEVTLMVGSSKDERLLPVKQNIESRLRETMDRCKRGDLVLMAFAGHGIQFDGDPDAYFCPQDARPLRERTDTLVSLGKVYKDFEGSFAGMKVLLVDACRNDPEQQAGRGARGITLDSAPSPPRGMAALFSCQAGQKAFEHPSLKHGVFFHHVLEALGGKGANGRGVVTFSSMADHVTQEVIDDVNRLFGPNTRQSPNQKADFSSSPILIPKRDIASSAPEAKPATTADLRDMKMDEQFPSLNNRVPRVQILQPIPGTILKTTRLRLIGQIIPVKGDPPFRQIDIVVDDILRISRPVDKVKRDDGHRIDVQEDVDLTPNRDHRITLRVRNDASVYHEASVDVRSPASSDPGRLFVLAIGISNYQNASVRKLLYAHRDAEEFLRVWESQTGQGLYRRLEPKLIVNEAATTPRIREEFEALAAEVRRDDTVVIFVAGQSIVRDRDDAYFLAGYDSDPAKVSATALPLTEIAGSIEQIHGRNVILFLDASRSGMAEGVFTPLRREFKNSLHRGLALYFACQTHEQKIEEPKDTRDGHGVFTRALLEAFSGDSKAPADRNSDQAISTQELMDFVHDRVPILSKDSQHPIKYALEKPSNFPLFRLSPTSTPRQP